MRMILNPPRPIQTNDLMQNHRFLPFTLALALCVTSLSAGDFTLDTEGSDCESKPNLAVEWADGSTRDGVNFGTFKVDRWTDGYSNGMLEQTKDPAFVRSGQHAMKVSIWGPAGNGPKGKKQTSKRAEFSDLNWQKHPIKAPSGERWFYWYSWSYFIPDDANWNRPGIRQYIGQWRYKNSEGAFPSIDRDGKHIGGSGHHLMYEDGRIELVLTPQDATCEKPRVRVEKFDLGPAVRGKWMDFIMQVRWSPETDGICRIWIQDGKTGYRQALDHSGPNWISRYNSDEKVPGRFRGQIVEAPNWQVGMYWSSDSPTPENPRILYVDEIRQLRTLAPATQESPAWPRLVLPPVEVPDKH